MSAHRSFPRPAGTLARRSALQETGRRLPALHLAGTAHDADGGPPGLAVVGITGKGRWQFSRDGGRSWSDLVALSPPLARLLAPDDRVRFLPARGWAGTATLTYRLWDRSRGTAGGLANLSSWRSVGGSTPFST